MAKTTRVHPWVAAHAGRIGFGIQLAPNADFATAKEIALAAERVGFETLWVPDHPVLGSDSWTRLAGLAEAPERVPLRTMRQCGRCPQPVQRPRTAAGVPLPSRRRGRLRAGRGDLPL